MNSGDVSARRQALAQHLEAAIRGKAKPIGALGRLEQLALQLGLATGSLEPDLGKALALVFAGDHGLTAEGVTAYPSEVTAEIAKLVLAGTAGVSVCASSTGIPVKLVDCGLLRPLDPHRSLIARSIASGTQNAIVAPAMSEKQMHEACEAGGAIANDAMRDGVGLFALGEIGIGNTSAAALLAHSVTGIALDTLVGPGAGIPARGLEHKRARLAAAISRAAINHAGGAARAFEAMRQFAGFEMVQMLGAMIAVGKARRVVAVDGFIATAVAAAALEIAPQIRDTLVFAHCSAEPGHTALLAHLDAEPLLDLKMRLGEGTGAVLAVPLIRAAELMLRQMADLPGEHPA